MMVDLLDANVLVDAFREDAVDHTIAKAWLDNALNQQRPISVPVLAEVAFLRLVTHPTIFPVPAPLEKAVQFLSRVYASRGFQIAPWTLDIQAHFIRLATHLKLHGNDMNDVSLAAIAEVMDWRLVSRDQGFRRFPKLKWLDLSTWKGS